MGFPGTHGNFFPLLLASRMNQRVEESPDSVSGVAVMSCWPDPALILWPPEERKYLAAFFSVWDSFIADPHVTYSLSVI